jgi:uncharacterized oxidoreductase
MSVSNSIKTILILGATSGIGESFARRFHAQGKKVIATGRREANLAKLKADCPGLETYVLDNSDLAGIPSHAETLLSKYPTIDTVWVNSGIQQSFSFADAASVPSDAALVNEVTINITAPTLLAKYFLPHLQRISAKQETFFMITSSGIAFVPAEVYPVYSATKAATHHLAVALRADQLTAAGKEGSATKPVRIVEIAPPYVATELDLNHKAAAGGLEPMPLKEYTDATLEVLQTTRPEDVKEIGVGFSDMGIKAWRGAFQPILEYMGRGAA